MAGIQRHLSLALFLGLAACAPAYVERPSKGPEDIPARRALFAANPETLDEAFQMGCQSPGDSFTRPDRETARCSIVPTPESAAFLLIKFDAELEAPRLIVQKITRPLQDCVLVEISYFAEIRAKSGRRQQVYLPNRMLDRRLDAILRQTGGTTVADVPDAVACA